MGLHLPYRKFLSKKGYYTTIQKIFLQKDLLLRVVIDFLL